MSKTLKALPEYDREDDGDSYVAIGYKARTRLGRMLAPGFHVPDVEPPLRHASLIGAILASGLRDKSNFTAIYGPEYDTALPPATTPEQRGYIVGYLREVYQAHPVMAELLRNNTLPIALVVPSEDGPELLPLPQWYLDCLINALPAPPSS